MRRIGLEGISCLKNGSGSKAEKEEDKKIIKMVADIITNQAEMTADGRFYSYAEIEGINNNAKYKSDDEQRKVADSFSNSFLTKVKELSNIETPYPKFIKIVADGIISAIRSVARSATSPEALKFVVTALGMMASKGVNVLQNGKLGVMSTGEIGDYNQYHLQTANDIYEKLSSDIELKQAFNKYGIKVHAGIAEAFKYATENHGISEVPTKMDLFNDDNIGLVGYAHIAYKEFKEEEERKKLDDPRYTAMDNAMKNGDIDKAIALSMDIYKDKLEEKQENGEKTTIKDVIDPFLKSFRKKAEKFVDNQESRAIGIALLDDFMDEKLSAIVRSFMYYSIVNSPQKPDSAPGFTDDIIIQETINVIYDVISKKDKIIVNERNQELKKEDIKPAVKLTNYLGKTRGLREQKAKDEIDPSDIISNVRSANKESDKDKKQKEESKNENPSVVVAKPTVKDSSKKQRAI